MRVKVKQPDPPVAKEILAEAITKISVDMDKLLASGLNKKAIIVLLADATKLPRGQIRIVLDALPRLRGWYCR